MDYLAGRPRDAREKMKRMSEISDDDFQAKVREMLAEAKDCEAALAMAVGTASVCWDEMPTGIFDSVKAELVVRELFFWINRNFHMREKDRAVRVGRYPGTFFMELEVTPHGWATEGETWHIAHEMTPKELGQMLRAEADRWDPQSSSE